MKNINSFNGYLLTFPLSLLLLTSCDLLKKNDKKIEGCTDPTAYNYNVDADDDDGSCILECPKRSSALAFTTDNGQTWEKSCVFNNIGAQYRSDVIDVSVIDENNIWLCTAGPATILYSSDKGFNWDVQFDDQSKTVYFDYLEMFDAFNGVAMGDGAEQPLILNTTDGGMTWNEVTVITEMSRSAFDRQFDFVNLDVGYTGNTGGTVKKTIDGGKNWTDTNYPANFATVVKFYDEDIGCVATVSDIYQTNDGGATWNKITLPESPGWPRNFEYAENDPSKIWFLGEDNLWFSNDSGSSWAKQIQFQHPKGNIQDMVIAGGYGWAIGYNSNNTCYKATDPENGNWESFDLNPQNNFESLNCIDGTADGLVLFPGYMK